MLTVQQRRSLAVIERNSGRLLRLVQDLLLAAELRAGRFTLDVAAVDLSDLAAQCVDAAAPAAERKGVALRLDADPGCTAIADQGRIAEVLDNLVDNAIKFSAKGAAVTVKLRDADDRCRLEVIDTGMGIPAAERDRLFERFSRTAAATAHHLPGTGLGLFLTRSIVEAHQGSITLASVEGEGTTVSVELPSARPVMEDGRQTIMEAMA